MKNKKKYVKVVSPRSGKIYHVQIKSILIIHKNDNNETEIITKGGFNLPIDISVSEILELIENK